MPYNPYFTQRCQLAVNYDNTRDIDIDVYCMSLTIRTPVAYFCGFCGTCILMT